MTDINSFPPVSYAQQLTHLLNVGQVLCGQTCVTLERICQEVECITQGKVQLYLCEQKVHKKTDQHIVSVSFPVQFGGLMYGTLCVLPNSAQPTLPAFPLDMALLLAQICSWLLYTLEQSALQSSPNTDVVKTRIQLTKCEKEILRLIGHHYNRESIAQILNITPATVSKHKQNIYKKLDVHCEHDALVVAHRAGLFSPLLKSEGNY